MPRIFSFLALLAVVSLAGVMLLGLQFHGMSSDELFEPANQPQLTVHRLSGVAAGLVVLLVESIVVTYFIGTGRWCKEVVEAYSLAPEVVRRSTRLKRRAFPVALGSMLLAVMIVALGGAADPGAALRAQPPAGFTWANIHLAGAVVGSLLIAAGFYHLWNLIHANQQLIHEVLADVRRIRIDRGLET